MKRFLKNILPLMLAFVMAFGSFAVSADTPSENTAVRISEGESAEFTVVAEKSGEYLLEFTYKTVPGRQISPEADIELTGNNVSFNQHIEFSRIWKDEQENGRFRTDSYGNEVTPLATELDAWQTAVYGISASKGGSTVSLEAGEYSLKVNVSCESVLISKVSFYQRELKSYEEYLNEYKGKKSDSDAEPLKIEAELMSSKSDSSVIPTYDRSSPSLSPNYYDRISLNIMGGSSFSKADQWVEWTFEVKKSGFYSLDFRYQQDSLRGIGVSRRIYIDGAVPFAEFDNVLFPYAQNYKTMRLENSDGEEYKLYLEAGEHTIRMQVNIAHLEQSILDLQQLIENSNSMYRQIISITGTTPDVYRDYYLEKELPELIPFLESSNKELERIAGEIEKWALDDDGSETSVIYDLIRVFKRYIEKPYKIPATLDDFKNGIDSIATMVVTLQTQSLTLDYFNISPAESAVDEGGSGIFEYMLFRLRIFLNSFVSSYTVSSEGKSNERIDVWVNMGDMLVSGAASGRDQMQIIKRMCDDSFTEQSGVGVDFSLVAAGDTLTQAVLAGKGPDVSLFVAEQTVANLALRGVLADVSEIENFESIYEQYHPSAFIPYTFSNGVYATPITQNFNMMFYRTDVFEQLGLEAPDTWDEFYAVQKVLIQHKLEIGIAESQDIFEMFLLQNGGSIYNEGLTASALKEQNAVDAFTQWTDLYVKHSLPLVFNFFNRFRTGEMPLGIMSYTMYNQLVVAAPEIEGLWEMCPIPATVSESGELNRSQSSSGNGCIVLAGSENIDAAYSFVAWWSDSDVQEFFGQQVETLLGKSARYNTANTVAFENLNWTAKERNSILSAWNDVTDIEQTVATYYVGRCVSNAFRRVAYNYENPRDVLYRYSDDIDRELERKREVMHLGEEDEADE